MRKALDLMEAERLLTRRQGRGTFVNDQSSDELAARFSNIRGPDGKRVCGRSSRLRQPRGRRTRWSARGCGCIPRTASIRIHRVRHHKGQVFLVEDASLPAALFPAWRRRRPSPTASSCLAQEYGILLGKAEERVSLAGAPPAVAQKLGVAATRP